MSYRLLRRQVVPRSLSEVFSFFERPENLATLTPPWLHFTLLSASPVPMRAGQMIDYSLRLMGLRLRWRSEITHYAPPHGFTDEQRRGPYQRWSHRHTFEESAEGVTITDDVEYEIPYGVVGQIAHVVYVQWALKRIFDYRAHMIAEVFR